MANSIVLDLPSYTSGTKTAAFKANYDWAENETDSRQEGKEFVTRTTYVDIAAVTYPRTMVVKSARAADGSRRNSVAINTWARVLDTNSDVIPGGAHEVSVVVAVNTPGLEIDPDDLGELLACAFSTLYTESAGTPDFTPLGKVIVGLTKGIDA